MIPEVTGASASPNDRRGKRNSTLGHASQGDPATAWDAGLSGRVSLPAGPRREYLSGHLRPQTPGQAGAPSTSSSSGRHAPPASGKPVGRVEDRPLASPPPPSLGASVPAPVAVPEAAAGVARRPSNESNPPAEQLCRWRVPRFTTLRGLPRQRVSPGSHLGSSGHSVPGPEVPRPETAPMPGRIPKWSGVRTSGGAGRVLTSAGLPTVVEARPMLQTPAHGSLGRTTRRE